MLLFQSRLEAAEIQVAGRSLAFAAACVRVWSRLHGVYNSSQEVSRVYMRCRMMKLCVDRAQSC
jgi:hypothetical protein